MTFAFFLIGATLLVALTLGCLAVLFIIYAFLYRVCRLAHRDLIKEWNKSN